MGLKCYTVYHGTKIIGDNAFYISKIESIILPNGLTCIGNAAFSITTTCDTTWDGIINIKF
ncbi:leucine-rich repeat protein [Prevotella sp. P5-126]|uniref:leucine-rich repeat protein n=1 Tax=Prevotella sp. P5-126 TaxID=2024216 RepID=UPI00117EA6ED|nr:leucine-rich repeat protein [Prevotella sp. P5-126]